MKKNTILFLLSIFALWACNNVQRQQSKNEEAIKLHTIDSLCVSYVENHLEGFNNEVTREKTAKVMQRMVIDTIKTNPNLLFEIPLKYESVVEKGNSYIVRFSTGSRYQWTDRRICDISLWFYSIVDEGIIRKLKTKKLII